MTTVSAEQWDSLNEDKETDPDVNDMRMTFQEKKERFLFRKELIRKGILDPIWDRRIQQATLNHYWRKRMHAT